ncbi:hypothetical protein ACR3K2_27320 [Cryptosporidium serpentis]
MIKEKKLSIFWIFSSYIIKNLAFFLLLSSLFYTRFVLSEIDTRRTDKKPRGNFDSIDHSIRDISEISSTWENFFIKDQKYKEDGNDPRTRGYLRLYMRPTPEIDSLPPFPPGSKSPVLYPKEVNMFNYINHPFLPHDYVSVEQFRKLNELLLDEPPIGWYSLSKDKALKTMKYIKDYKTNEVILSDEDVGLYGNLTNIYFPNSSKEDDIATKRWRKILQYAERRLTYFSALSWDNTLFSESNNELIRVIINRQLINFRKICENSPVGVIICPISRASTPKCIFEEDNYDGSVKWKRLGISDSLSFTESFCSHSSMFIERSNNLNLSLYAQIFIPPLINQLNIRLLHEIKSGSTADSDISSYMSSNFHINNELTQSLVHNVHVLVGEPRSNNMVEWKVIQQDEVNDIITGLINEEYRIELKPISVLITYVFESPQNIINQRRTLYVAVSARLNANYVPKVFRLRYTRRSYGKNPYNIFFLDRCLIIQRPESINLESLTDYLKNLKIIFYENSIYNSNLKLILTLYQSVLNLVFTIFTALIQIWKAGVAHCNLQITDILILAREKYLPYINLSKKDHLRSNNIFILFNNIIKTIFKIKKEDILIMNWHEAILSNYNSGKGYEIESKYCRNTTLMHSTSPGNEVNALGRDLQVILQWIRKVLFIFGSRNPAQLRDKAKNIVFVGFEEFSNNKESKVNKCVTSVCNIDQWSVITEICSFLHLNSQRLNMSLTSCDILLNT